MALVSIGQVFILGFVEGCMHGHARIKPIQLLHDKIGIWVVVNIRVPFWALNIRCRNILRTQKGTIILTTTHVAFRVQTRL